MLFLFLVKHSAIDCFLNKCPQLSCDVFFTSITKFLSKTTIFSPGGQKEMDDLMLCLCLFNFSGSAVENTSGSGHKLGVRRLRVDASSSAGPYDTDGGNRLPSDLEKKEDTLDQ